MQYIAGRRSTFEVHVIAECTCAALVASCQPCLQLTSMHNSEAWEKCALLEQGDGDLKVFGLKAAALAGGLGRLVVGRIAIGICMLGRCNWDNCRLGRGRLHPGGCRLGKAPVPCTQEYGSTVKVKEDKHSRGMELRGLRVVVVLPRWP